jgi:zinc protease
MRLHSWLKIAVALAAAALGAPPAFAARDNHRAPPRQWHAGHREARPSGAGGGGMVWYRIGSIDEVNGTTGVAHARAHDVQRHVQTAVGEFSRPIAAAGGSWNGYTWIDQTTYLETATKDALDRMLFIESERMANCLYHPDDCESERTVIISELHGGENDPDQFLDQEVIATAFKAHPYRNPVIGWMSDLENMRVEDAREFYQRWYTPNNAVLVVVGDVSPEQVIALGETFRRFRLAPAAGAQAAGGAAAARP